MFFLDPNILVYAWDAKDQRKQSIASSLIRRALVGEGVSQQVLGEFAAVLLHKMKPATSPSEVLHEPVSLSPRFHKQGETLGETYAGYHLFQTVHHHDVISTRRIILDDYDFA